MTYNWKKYFFEEIEKNAGGMLGFGNLFLGATTVGSTALDIASNKAQMKAALNPKKLEIPENDYGYMFDRSTVNLRNQNRSLFR